MKEHIIYTYEFDELSDKVKQKALGRLQDINIIADWWDYIYDDADEIGIKITEFDIDRNMIKGEMTLEIDDIAQNIINRYKNSDCEVYKEALEFIKDKWELNIKIKNIQITNKNFTIEKNEDIVAIEEDIEIVEENFFNSIMEDYLVLLKQEYEYLISDEVVIETIKINNYEFTKDGKVFISLK
jgi:hypothetical protein